MKKTLSALTLSAFLCGCGMDYFVKSQAQSFSESAAQVAIAIEKVPDSAKELELDFYSTLVRADRGCVPAAGKIHVSRLLRAEDPVLALSQFGDAPSTCKPAWEHLHSCRTGGSCNVCNGKSTDADCKKINLLAAQTEYCVAPAVAKSLAASCAAPNAGGLWQDQQIFGERRDAAAGAYKDIAALASASANYVSALSALSVDRKDSSAKFVTEAVKDLQDSLKKIDELANSELNPLGEEKQKAVTAVSKLLALLHEWREVHQDSAKISALVVKQGPEFDANMLALQGAVKIIESSYSSTLVNADTAILTDILRNRANRTTDGEAVEILKQIEGLKRKRAAIGAGNQMQAVIEKTVAAHGDLVRIIRGDLTREEEESVMRQNIRQFNRLLQSVRDVVDAV